MRAATAGEDSPGASSRRAVGAIALLALGVNGIVGVGIFFVPADVARRAPGSSSVLVFAAMVLVLAPVALSVAMLGRRFDEDGGPVVFARAAFGELASFLVGWVSYVSALFSTAAVMSGLANAVAPSLGLTGPLGVRVAASTLVTSLALLVAAGIVLSARVWTTLTVLKLLPLVALAGAFLLSGQVTALPPLAPAAEVSWLRAALLATFAYQGFEIVPVIAGHVRSPSSAVPIATLGSVGFAALLYVILQSACVVVLPHLASSAAPLAEAAGVLGGPALARAVAVGTSVSALGICFGMMVTTPRYLSALAHGRSHVLALDRETAQGVPLRALGVTWVVVMVLLQVGSRAELFALSAIAVVTQFVVTAAALAALAHRRERGLRRWHLAVALPAMAVGLGLVSGATAREAAAAAGAVLLGLVLRRVGRMEQARPAPAEGVG